MNELMNRIDGLVRFANDIEYRIGDSGLGGLSGIAGQMQRIRQALDRIQPQEIDWARAEVQSLIDSLGQLARNFDEIREVKILLGGGAPQQFVNQPSGDGYVTG